MNKKNLKLTDKGKHIIIIFLSLLLVITGTLAISLYSNNDKNFNNEISEVISEKKVMSTDNNIVHNPTIINVDVTFEKKAKQITPITPPAVNVPAGSKYCVLTFDDGPGVSSTQKILDVLARYNVKGTWFVLGSRVHTYPQMAQSIANAGHEIANHSYSHPDLTTLSYNGYMNEINSTQSAILNVTGKTSYYLRPPYGSYTYELAQNCGLGIALWNVDSLDWSYRNAQLIYNEVMANLRTTSVILFHDIYNFTADAVEMIVPALINHGYTFITYSQYMQLGG